MQGTTRTIRKSLALTLYSQHQEAAAQALQEAEEQTLPLKERYTPIGEVSEAQAFSDKDHDEKYANSDFYQCELSATQVRRRW